jgi:hypothetical protein
MYTVYFSTSYGSLVLMAVYHALHSYWLAGVAFVELLAG